MAMSASPMPKPMPHNPLICCQGTCPQACMTHRRTAPPIIEGCHNSIFHGKLQHLHEDRLLQKKQQPQGGYPLTCWHMTCAWACMRPLSHAIITPPPSPSTSLSSEYRALSLRYSAFGASAMLLPPSMDSSSALPSLLHCSSPAPPPPPFLPSLS